MDTVALDVEYSTPTGYNGVFERNQMLESLRGGGRELGNLKT
jgi:hypothetical protein